MDIIVWKKAIYISASDVLLVQVEHLDIRIVFKDHTCNNLIADLQRFARAVSLYVLAHLDDLAGSLVTERYRNQSERILFEFMGICSTVSPWRKNWWKNFQIIKRRSKHEQNRTVN